MKKISLTAIMLTVGLSATAFDYAKNVCDLGDADGCKKYAEMRCVKID